MHRLGIITVLLLFCTAEVFSQYSWQKPKGTYGFIFGFDFGMRDIRQKESIDLSLYGKNNFGGVLNESALLSFRLGFNYSRYLGNDLFLKSGLRIINPAYDSYQMLALNSSERATLVEQGQVNLRQGYKYRYLFVEVPLHLRYVYSGKNCRSYVEAGVTGAYYLGTQLESKQVGSDSNPIKVREDISPLYISGVLAIGAEYDLTDNLPAFIQLVFRGQINEIDKGLVSERMYSMGIEFGSRHYF